MPYILAISIGTIVGMLAKGKVSNYLEFKIQKAWIFIAAFVSISVFQVLAGRYETVNNFTVIVQGLAYILILIGVWFNREYIGIIIIGLGCISNAMVILLNNGKMPVSEGVTRKANIIINASNIDIKHTIMQIGDKTHLSFLADRYYIPGWMGILMRIVSIGDLIIVLGLFLVTLQIVAGWKLDIKAIKNTYKRF